MNCPKCGEQYFYPENHIAYYDKQFASWAEAMVYKCDKCGNAEFARLPLGSVLDNMGEVPELNLFGFDKFQLQQEPEPYDDDILRSFKYCRKAQGHQAREEYPKAASCALAFCRGMAEKLDVIWYAWAVSLAEKAGDEKVLKEARGLYLGRCLEYKKGLESRECAYRAELLGILEREISRLQ